MIHPTALVDPAASLADDVEVGAFSIIGPDVEIGAGTVIGPHVVVKGPTTIGCNNQIYQFSSIGEDPQDKKFDASKETTRLAIGDNNLIREYVSINRGTKEGGGITRIGSDNWIMAYCHVAHDCVVGNHTIFSNAASLAGHVKIGDHAILSGFTLVSQFCRIGDYAFTSMGSAINRDVPPYLLVSGNMAKPFGINSTGLKRHDFSADEISEIKRAYKTVYKSGLQLNEAISQLEDKSGDYQVLRVFVDFIANSERGIIR